MTHPRILAIGVLVAGVLTPVFSDAQLFTLTKEQLVELHRAEPVRTV